MRRGQLWWIDFPPATPESGHEQAGRRPGLIVSSDAFNSSPAGLVVAMPLTRTDRGIRTHVRAGTSPPSFILCEQVRSLSKKRLVQRLLAPMDSVSSAVLGQVEDVLRLLLGLTE